MKVYVAGSSKEIERAERVIAALRERGIEITFDWPAQVRAVGSANEGPDEVLLPALLECLEAGVFGADIVLVLAPTKPSTGVWVELGTAWAHAMRIDTAGDLAIHPWLRALANVSHRSDDEAVGAIVELARSAETRAEA